MAARVRYPHLRAELEAIASEELAAPLANWCSWSDEQYAKLARYLREEMSGGGLLSVEHGREAGMPLGEVRRDARRLLARGPDA